MPIFQVRKLRLREDTVPNEQQSHQEEQKQDADPAALFIYLAALGLRHGAWDLHAACGIEFSKD